MAQRTAACTHCHGEQGRAGPDGYYPRLAGKPALYLYNQLKNFKEDRRQYHLMAGLLAPLSDAYLWDIAQYFSSIQVPYPPPLAQPTDPRLMRRGKSLALEGDPGKGIPACVQCHGKQLTGMLPATPALLGLPRDYLNAQLGAWQTGQRSAHAPDCMSDIAKRLTPQDVNAVTLWLSQKKPLANTHPAARREATATGSTKVVCGSERSIAAEVTPPARLPTDATVPAVRGAYLARIGNCALCHTAPGAPAYAGGRAIDTPFGKVYASNITPDKKTGIGTWSRDDFWNTLHHGKGKDGQLLNPAFPYTSYTHVTRDDADALYAFLQTLAPVSRANLPHALRWPYGTQTALWAWRTLYFNSVDAPLGVGAPIDRGAYLVRGLAHCSECHGKRSRWGGLDKNGLLAGATLPGLGWVAPALQGHGSRPWTESTLRQWLQTGATRTGTAAQAAGPMAEVIHHSTQYLNDADATAIAAYISKGAATARTPPPQPADAGRQTDARIGKLYETQCAQCHGKQGEGIAGAIPALAGNPAVTARNVNNLVLMVLYGGFAPSTAANPQPYGMPPFMLDLNDADLAALFSWLRSSWGNAAPAVTEFDINKIRNATSR